MDASSTSLSSSDAGPNTVSTAGASGLRGEWRSFFTFLKRPRLPARAASASGASVMATFRMLGLDLGIMAVLSALAAVLVAVGLDLPESAIAKMEMNAELVLLVVLFAPISEELMFRGFLSGRPGHLLAIALIALAFAAMAALPTGFMADTGHPPLLPYLVIGGAVLASLAALFFLRARPAVSWFAWAFPAFFWLATLAFALVHLMNYEEGSLAFLLPFVIPQLVLGAILGYVRVHYGLWAAIALHMTHNALLIGIVLTAMKLGGVE